MSEVGILIVDDDLASQRALKLVLDAEGWRVRIVPTAALALTELATGAWNLVVVNASIVDGGSPLFATLKDLIQGDLLPSKPLLSNGTHVEQLRKCIRVLFLVPAAVAKSTQPILEREGLPYAFKPYHLNDFLEKVSELLVEAGAIVQPIRSIGGFVERKNRGGSARSSRNARRNSMFASREDYQMSEEEMAEFERQEEEDRRKREKAAKDRTHLG